MTREEFYRLTELFLDDIYRVALNGCKNKYDAEDLTQEVFFKLLNCNKKFESDDHVRHWLIRVAVNECNSFWRKPWKRKVTYLEDEADIPQFSAQEDSDLYHAVMELPDKYRQIIYLFYYENYSVRELAGIFRLSETAVKTRLKRGREKLKEQLREAWEYEE